MAHIQDGMGTGTLASVDTNNRLNTYSVTTTAEHDATHTFGKGWHIVIQETPTAAGTFFYFKNTSETVTYIFEGFASRVASAEAVEIYLNKTGTPSAGTAVEPCNTNTKYQSSAINGTIETGTTITGLSNGNLLDRVYLTNTDSKTFNFELDVAVAPGGVIIMNAVTGSIAIDMTVHVYAE